MRDIPIYQLARVFARNRMHWKFRLKRKTTDESLTMYRKGRLSSIDTLWSDISQLGEKE